MLDDSLARAEGHKPVITGSSTLAPLVAEIGKRFETRHPVVRVDLQTGGSSRGIADVLNGGADIGMAARALKSQEQHLHGSIIAHDGITIILHLSNSVQELTDDQIRTIYTGGITLWNQVGGPDAPITAMGRVFLNLQFPSSRILSLSSTFLI